MYLAHCWGMIIGPMHLSGRNKHNYYIAGISVSRYMDCNPMFHKNLNESLENKPPRAGNVGVEELKKWSRKKKLQV